MKICLLCPTKIFRRHLGYRKIHVDIKCHYGRIKKESFYNINAHFWRNCLPRCHNVSCGYVSVIFFQFNFAKLKTVKSMVSFVR